MFKICIQYLFQLELLITVTVTCFLFLFKNKFFQRKIFTKYLHIICFMFQIHEEIFRTFFCFFRVNLFFLMNYNRFGAFLWHNKLLLITAENVGAGIPLTHEMLTIVDMEFVSLCDHLFWLQMPRALLHYEK